MVLYFFLGLFVSSTIFLIIFNLYLLNKDKKELKSSTDYEVLKELNPDESIEKSDFYR